MPKRTLRLYSPHDVQRQFHDSTARYRVMSTGRQMGKSTCAVNELAFKAWVKPRKKYWFVSPTFDQAKGQYRRLIGMLWGCPEVMLKKNQTELRVKLINQSEIVFKSGEVFDNLRGDTLDGVVVDEYRDQPKGLWSRVLQPMLRTTGGWAAFISTPNGFDDFFELSERARINEGGSWFFLKAPSTANPLFTQDELEEAKREMSEGEFAQEILAEFRDLQKGKTYVNNGEWNQSLETPFAAHRRKDDVWGSLVSPYLPIIVACDFNVTPIAWLIGQQSGGKFYWFDEVFLERTNTQEACVELLDRLRHYRVNQDIVVIGDASGAASKTSASGDTDYSIIMQALTGEYGNGAARNETPASNPRVKDRVNVMNSALKAANGDIRFFYHPIRCKNLKRDLERVSWKAGANAVLDQVTDKTLTHISDAAGYAVWHYSSTLWSSPPGTLRMLAR